MNDDNDDDEDNCPNGSYECSNSNHCILDSLLCDQQNDCGNWEDESKQMCG